MCGYFKFPAPKALKAHKGAVLIMVLLIVALVAGLGIKFAGDYQLGLARAEARWHGMQARTYLFSGEGAAIQFLSSDDAAIDHPDELWGQPVPLVLPDNGGELLLQVEDANSKFNLNSLSTPIDPAKSPVDASRYSPSQRMFIRLLQAIKDPKDPNQFLVLGIDQATAIVEAIVDWTDQDTQAAGIGGAENDYYQGQREPYQAANMDFRSIEELQLVRGITPELMQELRPYITVLDKNERLNVNTMPSILFRCFNVASDLSPLPESIASSMAQNTPTAGFYATLDELNDSLSKSGLSNVATADKDVAIKTNYFWLTTLVNIGSQQRQGRSLLARGNPQFKVVRREEMNVY